MQPFGQLGDLRAQQEAAGNLMTNSPLACVWCGEARPCWCGALAILRSLRTPKSLLLNAIDVSCGDASRGYVRKDALLSELHMPVSEQSLKDFLDQRDLWAALRIPDFLHANINHSRVLRALLLKRLPAAAVRELDTELQREVHFTLTQGTRMGWQWRALWAAAEIWHRILMKYELPVLDLLVSSWRRVLAFAYSPTSIVSIKGRLRYFGDSFTHFTLFNQLSGHAPLLAEHTIWPHGPEFASIVPLSFGLMETVEGTFRVIRRISQYCAPHGANSITEYLQRLELFFTLRRAKVRLHRKPKIRIAVEPCERCVGPDAAVRTVLQSSVLGFLFPLESMLAFGGFVEGESWRRIEGGIQLFDSHLDKEPERPALLTLSQARDALERKRKELLPTLFSEAKAPAPDPASPVVAAADSPAAPQLHNVEADDEFTGADSDDFMTDEDFDAVFGSAEEQQQEEDDEAEEAAAAERGDPDYRAKLRHPGKRTACPRCGSLSHVEHASTGASAGSGVKMSLD